jgi:hypothetical protein
MMWVLKDITHPHLLVKVAQHYAWTLMVYSHVTISCSFFKAAFAGGVTGLRPPHAPHS